VINDNVASFAGGLWSHNALCGDDLSSEWCLVFVGVDWYISLIPVWFGLKKALLLLSKCLNGDSSSSDSTDTCCNYFLCVVSCFDDFCDLLRGICCWGESCSRDGNSC
jgi:hypothetical protein